MNEHCQSVRIKQGIAERHINIPVNYPSVSKAFFKSAFFKKEGGTIQVLGGEKTPKGDDRTHVLRNCTKISGPLILSKHEQVNPGENYDSLLISLG